jgi:hypothetical protein
MNPSKSFFVPTFHQIIGTKIPPGSFFMHLIFTPGNPKKLQLGLKNNQTGPEGALYLAGLKDFTNVLAGNLDLEYSASTLK